MSSRAVATHHFLMGYESWFRRHWLSVSAIAVIAATVGLASAAAVTVAPVFSDGVVLQAHHPLPIWGTAQPGETVRVSLRDHQQETVTSAAGTWRVTLPPLKYADGETLERLSIQGEAEQLVREVHVGEVWIVVGPQTIRAWRQQSAAASPAETAALDAGRRSPTAPALALLKPRDAEQWHWDSAEGERREEVSATGYFFAEHLRETLARPVGVIDLSDPQASVLDYLAEEDLGAALMAPEARSAAQALAAQRRGYELVESLAPFAIRGVLWAQSEADVEHADVYAEWLLQLIVRWRAEFENLTLPFIIMQLPVADRGESWVAMRAAQATVGGLVLGASVAITTDIDSCETPPYASPRALGDRLARLARDRAYQENLPSVGAVSAGRPKTEAERITVQFFNAGEGVVAQDQLLHHFEIEDASRHIHPVPATLVGPRELVVPIPTGVEPLALRYGWSACFESQLSSADGRPVAPFRMSFTPTVDRGPERWRSTINAYRRQDHLRLPPPEGVLFIGSSSIRLWSSLRYDFPDLTTINRGFGGSVSPEAHYFFDEIVRPYRPRTIVFYSGENDIAGGKAPADVLAAFQEFCRRTQQTFPQTRILFLSLKPSPFRWHLWPQMVAANRLIETFCAHEPGVDYVDVASALLDEHGVVDSRFFTDDDLHMNASGYRQWVQTLRPHLASPGE